MMLQICRYWLTNLSFKLTQDNICIYTIYHMYINLFKLYLLVRMTSNQAKLKLTSYEFTQNESSLLLFATQLSFHCNLLKKSLATSLGQSVDKVINGMWHGSRCRRRERREGALTRRREMLELFASFVQINFVTAG